MDEIILTEDEKQLLKVAKMNQVASASLKNDMEHLSNTMKCNIAANEDFLRGIENQMGIDPSKVEHSKDSFRRESDSAPLKDWSELVLEAEQAIPDDINFEDLLSEAEFEEAYKRLDEIDAKFEKKTGLKKKDFPFLAVAIAMQCARQYVLDPWLKSHRRGAGPKDEKGRKNNADAGWYYVETDKILTNRVPYDVQHYGGNSTIDGFLKGGDHRAMTLGHDPVLGWIFGTANIMTSTVTRRDFMSAHVKCINNENKIHSLASTEKIFEAVGERVFEKGIDGKLALGAAIVREAIHLKSDIDTKRSLPFPIVSTLSPELSKKLAEYGIDIASVSTEASFSMLINTIIGMVHCLCFNESEDDKDFYEVRTRKIILYSNLIASTSNVIASVFTERYDLLDVGGLLVTISRLITDVRFICKVKDEFVDSELSKDFEILQDELEDMYYKRFSEV